VDVPYDRPKKVADAWESVDPAAAQLVACVDLVHTGRSLDECRFDDPQPTTVPLVEGVYQLTLYEVATRRVVAERRVTGAGECPFVVLLTGERTIPSAVTGRQLYETLRRYVEK
jgi:hypothetical protein